MRTLSIPKYTPSTARCDTLFFRVLRPLRPKAPYVMQQLSTVLASRTTPSRPLSTEPFRGSSCFDNHPPPMVPQGRQRRLRSHRDPLTPPPLLHQSHAAGRLLAQRKIQKQHNNKGKTPPPYLALYFALWGRRWFLASLSSPALGSTSVPPYPDTQTTTTATTRGERM